ncbi:LamG domain-containing protein [Bdellovibrio sp. HCB185ZH]|uniref:LamG domain-containing protein n=1 Tax=Bdellovibrio sp. HCB185ZH TaxID=3394235 RepID=UPI0039A48C9D
MNKTIGSIMMILLSGSVSQAQIPGTQTGLPSAFNGQECKSPARAAWMPQANAIKAIWHFDGSGTITNGATIASAAPSTDATATIASSTLSYTSHSAAPAAIANFRQFLTATGNANDIIGVSGTALDNLPAATFSFWINISALPTTKAIRFFYKSDNNGSRGFFSTLEPSGQFGFIKVHSTNNFQVFSCPALGSYFINSWHHIVITWDGTSTSTSSKIYVDGTELKYTGAADPRLTGSCPNYTSYNGYNWQQAGTGGYSSDATYPFYLAGVPASTATNPDSTAFSGKMDEFTIWNTALTAAEVATLYKHQKCN